MRLDDDAPPARKDTLWPVSGGAVVRSISGALVATVAGTGALLFVGAIRARRRAAAHLDRLVHALAERDPATAGHSRRVAAMVDVIARALRLPRATAERVHIAALLHDVGKMDARYAPLIAKEGPLTPDEWAVMRTHAAVGAAIVARETRMRDALALRGVADAVRHHHERWDGSGYPDHLRTTEIPLEARIIAVADTIDAITSDRPYQRRGDEEAALAILNAGRGKHLDPRLCDRVLAREVWTELWRTANVAHAPAAEAVEAAGAPAAGIAADDAVGFRSLVEDLREEYERRLQLGLPLRRSNWLTSGEEPRRSVADGHADGARGDGHGDGHGDGRVPARAARDDDRPRAARHTPEARPPKG
jgi:putative nucleotidyltransferase with HDIG domain